MKDGNCVLSCDAKSGHRASPWGDANAGSQLSLLEVIASWTVGFLQDCVTVV